MAIYRIENKKLKQVNPKPFLEPEKYLQNLVEENLKELFNLDFITTEFNLENFWLDTLAYDPEKNSFVIIEYKKTESWSLIDQGQTYLNLLLDHKADVLLSYNEHLKKRKQMSEISWGASRIIFISPSFTAYQKRALAPNLPLELWHVKLYENNLLSLNKIEPLVFQRTGTIKSTLSGSAAKEIKVYSLDQVINKASSTQKELLNAIREKILVLDQDITESPGKDVLIYKLKKSFVFLWPTDNKDKLTVYFHRGKKLKDPNKLLKGRGKTGAFIYAKSLDDIPQIMLFVKQAYQLDASSG
jgi:predicted transport protein